MVQGLLSLFCRVCWAGRLAYYRKWWSLVRAAAMARNEGHSVREKALRAELHQLIRDRVTRLSEGHD